MRAAILMAVATIATGLVALPTLGDNDDDLDDLGKKGRPERVLLCDGSRPGGCDVSCVSTTGKVLFVHGAVERAFITEFAGSHTLLEIQKGNPAEIVSVLVGDISHCTLNGLRDPSLTRD